MFDYGFNFSFTKNMIDNHRYYIFGYMFDNNANFIHYNSVYLSCL